MNEIFNITVEKICFCGIGIISVRNLFIIYYFIKYKKFLDSSKEIIVKGIIDLILFIVLIYFLNILKLKI